MRSVKGREPQPEGEPSAEPRSDIAGRVLAYFRRNAEAMDSAEGIARFWVREDRDVVERCLTDLHSRGLLERRLIGGTAFYACHHDAAAVASSRVAGPAPDGPTGSGGRILVVDDDAAVREFLAAALTEGGHAVVAAEGGQRGIELFLNGSFDLVVTDIRMPGTSGLELLRTIKRQSPDVEVIVVTAHASLDTAIEALRDGAYDLITKPLPDIEALFRVVGRALEKRRLSEDNRRLVKSLHDRNLELTETVARLASVGEIGKATAGVLDVGDLYGSLVRLVAQHLKARRVSVLVAAPDSDTMTLVASVGIPEGEGTAFSLRVGEGIAGRVAASQTPLLVQDIGKTDLKGMGAGARHTTPSFMITPLTVSYPIRYQRKRVGVINVSDKHSGEPFNEQDLEFLSTLASQMAVAIENARLVKEMEDGYLAALVSMIQAAEDSRPETRGHSRSVAGLAVGIGRAMGLDEERVAALGRAAALHEVGRLAAWPQAPSDNRDPGGASAAQASSASAVMATERLLAPIASLRTVREIILQSTSWFDPPLGPFGNDYPAISIEAHVLSISEEFTRLTGEDGADPARRREALESIRRRAGKHDPEVVETILRVIGDGRAAGGGHR